MFRSVYSVSLRCSVYCLCVNVYWTTATGISRHFSATLTEVFPCFSSVVRQILGFNSQTRGTARFFPNLFFVLNVLFSVFCVQFMFKCILYYYHRVSTKCVLYYCHRVLIKCVLYYYHRVSTKCVLYYCHRVLIKFVLYYCHRALSNVNCTIATGC
jgi:hypothetical protein